jgi:uncharacterized membrane protein
MPSPEEQDDRIAALSERIGQLEARLAHLERLQPVQPPAPAVPPSFIHATQPVLPPPLPPAPEPVHHSPPPVPPTPPVFPQVAPETEQLETRMGLTWINRIGVITLVIGVAFFFKYAIDNQWIGETGRVFLGVLAGIATLVSAEFLWQRNQKVFAQGVCGLGVSILYLSFYASFAFYHLLPQSAAFVLLAMVTVLTGALALRYDAIAVAALGMLGGYATPLLLSTGQDAPWTFLSYLFLIDVGAVAIARPRRWRPLYLLAFLATLVLYNAWFGKWFIPEKQVVATVFLLAFYGLFVMVEWPWIPYLAQALAGATLVAIWPESTPFLVLSLMVGAAGLLVADLFRRPVGGAVSFLTFWGACGIWVSINGKPSDTVPVFLLLTIGFAMYLVWVPFEKLSRGVAIRTPQLIVLANDGAVYFGCGYILLKTEYPAWLGLFAAAVGAVHLPPGVKLWREANTPDYDSRPALLSVGIALAFVTLAVPIQFIGFSITLSWAIEAAALVWVGGRMRENRVQLAAGVVYVLILLRLYGFDAWVPVVHPLLINLRFLAFVASAASFFLGAWWLKNIRPPAAAAYVAGHFVFLSACLFELSDWVAASVSPEDQAGAMAIAVSLLMAVYAVVLIAAGVAWRSRLNRLLGLGLIGLVVLKLYLYDVWEASRLFRTAAFVSLGILLLLTSYLYSRFRPALETLWKEEKEKNEKPGE